MIGSSEERKWVSDKEKTGFELSRLKRILNSSWRFGAPGWPHGKDNPNTDNCYSE